MKRYITIALCALTVFGLGSCNKIHEEDFDNAVHTVTFQAQLGNDTRTGLALKFVPDWRETDETKDVHIWEVTGNERVEGEDIKKTIPGAAEGNYEIAYFKADFSNMTIIVNPPSNAPATRAGETYAYTAIVAQTDASGKFTVPSYQTPNSATLIDPRADFLVGVSTQDYSQSQAGKTLDLRFTRPVAISRLSIMNVEDPIIQQIRIYSSDKLTGSATYDNVNFENATVSFDNSGSNILTLDYGDGVAMPAEGIFNAYFVSLVGTKSITKIVVVTDKQTLTKEFEGGKALTFKVPDFKSIAVNMGGSGTPGPNPDQPQNIQFVRGTTVVTSDSYDLYTGGTYVSPTISGAAPGATLTYETGDPSVATVSTAGVVTPVGVGTTTITANASKVEGYQAGSAEFTLTVTDSTPDAVDQPLKFMKGGQEITSDTYDFYNGGTYVSPTLSGAVDGATVTWAITCTPEGCATIDTDGKVTPVAVGAVVVTATASAVAPLYKQTSKSYDLQIKNTTPVVGPTVTINLEAATELVAGEKYVLVSNGFALVRDGENASAAAFDATAMTVAVPTDLQETLEWTLEKKSGSITRGNEYVFTQGAYFFGIAMNTNQQTYTYTVEVNNGRNVATNISIQDHNLSLANALMYYAGNSSNYYVFYNTADNIWDNEKVANTASPAATSKTALYKLKDMRAEQNPTFTAATAEYDLNGPRWTVAVPTLQNAKGTVTYESNNTTVAQVNASTGAVTIMNTARKGDTAVITAKANGNDEYKPGSASYTISIINSAPVTTTAYYKVDQIVAGQQYIVVSGGNALTVNGTTLGAVAVVDNNGVIETSEDVAVWTAAEHIEYYSGTSAAGHFTLKSGDNYLQRKSNQSNQTAAVGNVPSTGKYYVWEYDGTHLYHLSSASTTFYMGYADNVWKFNYQTPYYEASLYSTTEPEAPVVVEQELSFSPESVSGKVGETVTKPTLTGAMTTVTYSSSNTAVVEVNSDGDLTLKSVGEAIITATAAAETVGGVSYAEGTATYTVNVSPADTPSTDGKTYTKINGAAELVTGTYVIVEKTDTYVYNASGSNHGGYGTIGTTAGISKSGSTITLSNSIASSYEFTFTRTGDNLTIQPVAGDNAGKYMYATNSVSDTYIAFQTNANNFTINSQSGDLVYFSTQKDGSAEYLYKKAADSFFKLGKSGAPGNGDAGIYLYKLNDGGTTPVTPDPPTPSTPTYSLITPSEFVSGGTYLIVSADSGNYNHSDKTKAFAGDQNGTAVDVDGTSGTITGDFSAYEFVITENGGNYTLKIGSNYVTGNSSNTYSRYIQVSSSAVTMSLTSASELSSAKEGDGLVPDAFYFYYTKGSGSSASTEVLYYNSDSKYKIGGTGRKYGAYLFKKN